jgi:hypothetical protein
MDDRHLSYIKNFIKKNPVSCNSTPPFKQPFFLSGEISPKRKRHSKFKIRKSSAFGIFQSPEVRKKKEVVKVPRFFYTWFLMCSQQVALFWLSRY